MDLKELLIKIKSETVITALSASFLLSFTLGFFGPATLYYTNIFEYGYTFSIIGPYLIALTILFGISLTFLSLLFKGKTQQRIICIIFAMGLLLYIQGNILVWDYGLLNGQEIIWNNYLINGIFESLIWIAIIAFSLLKSDKVYKFIPVVCFFLLIIQIGGLLALIYFAPTEPDWKSYSFDETGSLLEFSENSNVIIIVLDTFQSDVYQEIINENDDYKKMFAGFTYYRNTIGGYPTTIASIPLILTGKYYNNSVPLPTFYQISYESSLPKTLKENGYIVDMHGSDYLGYPKDNVNIKKFPFDYELILPQLTQLTKLTLFRHFPHFLKEATCPLLIEQGIYQENNFDVRFNDHVINNTIRLNNALLFKYYKLNGAHPPFSLNERLEYEELPNNRSGYKEQSKASLKIVGNLLEKLKEKGIFDNSIIIVTADHGMQNNGYGLNYSQMQSKNKISYVSDNIVTGGIPLLLFKPLNSNRSLAISDAPVSLSDIPKSVATELNLSNTFTGESVTRVQDSDNRNFPFYQYVWRTESEDAVYLPPLHEYTINNFSWYGASWQPTYNVYMPNGVEKVTPPDYNFGSTIHFGNGQQSQDFTSLGWSAPEDRFVWSDGERATIAFSTNRSNSTLIKLEISSFPFIVKHKHEVQRVTVYLNRHKLGDYSFLQDQSQNLDFLIPASYLNEQVQYITFDFPDAISPSKLGISDDSRNLAIGLSSFNLTEITSD